MGGPEIHLQIMNAALHGEFPVEQSLVASLVIITLSGVIAGALCFVVRQPGRRLLSVAGLSVGYAIFAQMLFDHAGGVIPLAVPLIVLVVSSLVVLAYDFVLERLERVKLRHTMGLYFSPRVLEAVLSDPGSMKPRRAYVTLLLTDLRNSTPLAEVLGPKGMFELLNRVFEAQTTAIMSEEGNLEHFLGDQFLSYWGAPQQQPDAADLAERAAMKLITAMENLRTTLTPEVQKLFGYGVALHSGSVLVGNKGSALRLDYGLVGDAVNEAARVEALTKYYGVRMIVTRDTFAQFQNPVHPAPARPRHREGQKRAGGIIRVRKSLHAAELRGHLPSLQNRLRRILLRASSLKRKNNLKRWSRNFPTAPAKPFPRAAPNSSPIRPRTGTASGRWMRSEFMAHRHDYGATSTR